MSKCTWLLVCSVVFASSGSAFSQDNDASPSVTVSLQRPVHIFLPGKISQIISESADIEVRNTDKNSVQIKVKTPGFQKTRIEIVMLDGRRFPFDVDFSDVPQGANVIYSSLNKKGRRTQPKGTRSDSNGLYLKNEQQ